MPKWMSFDYECPRCLLIKKGVLVEEGEKVMCCAYAMTGERVEMRRLPVGGPKNYIWGSGDNSASTVPARFRRDKQ